MCAVCGCSGEDHRRAEDHDPPHAHDHDHPHEHDHPHDHPRARVIAIEHDLLAKNQKIAARCRGWLRDRGVAALNLISSPGSGKTSLLARTIRDLGGRVPIAVIEGDQETARDADRIRAAGAKAVQINTGRGCHLDASMVLGALAELDPQAGSAVMIENVGNLVCPALFDLGEQARVVMASVTEGEDKPLKYPGAFRTADVMVLSKIDLLPHLDFDVDQMIEHARAVNPKIRILPLSARTGAGLDSWYAFLDAEARRR